jgi:glycoprotein endo-alpha-1,2-mannosidase
MNMPKWAFILVGVFFLSPALVFAAADKDYFVGTYYYPWYGYNNFHGPYPTGSTTLVYHLNPQMTPQLGWYNQWNPDVISQHYKWARYAGINFFVTSYWGSGSAEDNVIQNCMFNNPDRGDIKLAVFLEPVITPSNITDETYHLCDYYFSRPGYFRIDGKPVIFIYVTRAMSDANLTTYITYLRTAATSKGYAVYIVGDEVWDGSGAFKSSRVSLMDAITNYDVYGNLGAGHFATDSTLNTWQSDCNSWRTKAHSISREFIPAVSPGFNDRGVRSGHTPTSRKLYNETYAFGTLLSGMLDRAKSLADRDMIMVTSWNEWHEDTQIEPTISAPPTNVDDSNTTQNYTQGLYYNGYGMLYLNILRDKTTLLALCDYDDDGQVGFDDLAFLLDYWLDTCTTDINCIEADLTTNGTINFADFATCAQQWTGQ